MNKAYAFVCTSVILTGCASVPSVQPDAAPLAQTVLFASGSASIQPVYTKALNQFVDALHCKLGYNLVVEGHTDNTGKEVLNRHLSEQRAEAVSAKLVAKGIPASAITAVGYSAKAPVASNATAAGRAQNRRASVLAVLNAQGCKTDGGILPDFNLDLQGAGDQGVPKYLYRNHGQEGNG